MAREFRITPETAKVFRELISKPGAERYGREIGAETGLKPATVGNILSRLEEAGLARSKLEDADIAELEKRPRRRYYTSPLESKESILDKLLDRLAEPQTEHKNPSDSPAEDSLLGSSSDAGKPKWISSLGPEKKQGPPSAPEHPQSANTAGNSIRLGSGIQLGENARLGEGRSDSGKPLRADKSEK